MRQTQNHYNEDTEHELANTFTSTSDKKMHSNIYKKCVASDG